MPTGSRICSLAVRVLVAAACLLGIWESWKMQRSDELFWQDTAESIRAAIRLEPDCWWCYMQLARLDETDAEVLLQASLRLNPFNSDAAIDLGLRYESDRDFHRAEAMLLQAFAVDGTYAPRWSLANFYFRRGNLPAFWTWSRRAAEMPADDIGSLFELCWHASPDPKAIEANVIENDPVVIRQYIHFLIDKDQVAAAVDPALRLVRAGSPDSDQEMLFTLLDRLIAANDAASAETLWQQLIRQHWIAAESSFPNNPAFAREPLPVRFDWKLSIYDNGLHSWPGPSGLVTEFNGQEPENCVIAEQTVALPPGNYKLESAYHTRNIAANTGIHWEIADANSDTVLNNTPSLSSDTPAQISAPFSVGPDRPFVRLRLTYNRELGTTRLSGTLTVQSIRIQAVPLS